jgi:glycosyltransferase involved in cell wall biosynthesis
MRVALTNDMHANGGAMSLMAHRYVKALADAGHDATLITGQAADPLPADIQTVGWPYPERRGSGPLAMARFFRDLRQDSAAAFAKWRAGGGAGTRGDCWLAMVVPSAAGALEGGGSELPLLYICNSPWSMEWEATYQAQHGRAPNALARASGAWPRLRLEKRVIQHARAYTALSRIQLEWFSALHPCMAGRRQEVISGAVATDDFVPATAGARGVTRTKWGVAGGVPLVVCSRRLVPRTGVDLLIEGVAMMKRPCDVVVTGDGPERAALEVLAMRRLSGATDGRRVRFTGFLPPEELRTLTQAADVSVLPTRALEGFGLSAAEALACGAPVVATPVGALPDVVGRLDSRLVAKEATGAGIAAALEAVLSSPDLSGEAFRAKCRDFAVAEYSWERHRPAFVALAESLAPVAPGAFKAK